MRFALGILLILATSLPAHADPAWYRRKVQVEEKKAEETAEKEAELPIVGVDAASGPPGAPTTTSTTGFSQLSKPIEAKINTNLLFKRDGLTDSLGLDAGKLDQTDIGGTLFSAQFGMGWWWQPNLILSGFVRGGALFQETYYYMQVEPGLSLRYLFGKHMAFTGALAYGFGQGLTRVSSTHIPPPPDDVALLSRRGILYSGQFAYLFWPRRTLGLGPSVAYWGGKLGDRDNSMLVFGITIQDQRPNYNGDLTAW